MKIKRMLVERLNQRIDADVEFDESLNIITGSNGSGKTTFLKATWYLFSGNLTKALQEIYFKRLLLETDSLTIELLCDDPEVDSPVFNVSIKFHAPRFNAAAQWPAFQSNSTGTLDQIREGLWQFNAAIAINHDSLFFPTFRRVEGGFLLGKNNTKALRRKSNPQQSTSDDDELTLALRAASVALTFIENRFICSMSTTDVERLLADTQASIDSKQKSAYEVLAGSISQSIQKWQKAGEPADQSAEYLKRILGEVTAVERTRDGIIEPIRKLNSEINQYFPGREIKVDKLSLGEGSNSIDANALSAGEKQLLSFLCYAAVYNEHIFMVDEPELSLHLDWQRKLITSLRSLGPNHQYFFVTHSPSIYTKFSDYEISFDQYTK